MPEIPKTDENRVRRRSGVRRWVWLVVCGCVAFLLGTAVFLQSAMFREMLRRRVVGALEQATGMRVELRQFSFEPGRLAVALRGIEVRGPENRNEPPLFAAELVEASWKILSFWGLRADLRSLRVWNPRVYIAMDRDAFNHASPTAAEARRQRWIAQALALRVQRLEVLRGQIRLQSQAVGKPIPLDFRAENVHLALEYEPRAGRYSGKLDFQKAVLTRARAAEAAFSGSARFAVDPQRAVLESLELRSAASRLSAVGSLDDFGSPRLQFRYDLLVDWKEAATWLLARPGWQGQASWRGEGAYSRAQGWQLEGAVAVRAVQTAIPRWPSVPWSGRASLSLIRAPAPTAGESQAASWRAELKELQVEALGGRFTGDARFGFGPVAAARLELQADRVSVAALAGALRKAEGELPGLGAGWAGSVSGTTEIAFQGQGSDLRLRTDWRVEPSPVVPAGFTPVSGILRLAYQAGPKRLEIADSRLRFGETRVNADGWLDPADSRLSVSIDAPRSEQVLPMLQLLWKKSANWPVTLRGRSTTAFRWTGGAASPSIAGSSRASDFDYQGLRWDAFSGRFNYHGGRAAELKIESGKLLRGSEAVEFTAGLELDQGAFTPQSPFTAAATLREANPEDLRKLAAGWFPPTSFAAPPIRGMLQGSFQASGTLHDPRGKGNLELTAGEVYGESFSRLTAQLILDSGGVLSARQLRLQKGQGTVEGEGTIGLAGGQVRFSLTASNLALESFNRLRARSTAAGLMAARLTGAGAFSRPAIEGRIEISRLAVAGQHNGQLSIGLDAAEGQAKLSWTGNLFGGEVRGSASVQLQPRYPYSARVDFANLDGVSLLGALRDVPSAVEARVGGTATIQGELKDAAAIRAAGEIGTLSGSAGKVEFHNAQPLRFVYEDGSIRLQAAHLAAKDADLEVSGTVSLARERAMNLGVRGTLDLAALGALLPELASSGQVSLNATLNGTLRKPAWKGRLDFSGASLRFGSFPNSLGNLEGTLILDGNRAILQNVAAESGGGSVKLGGQLTYLPAGFSVQLAAELANVRVRYPEGVSTWLDGQLTLRGSSKASTLSGTLVIKKETANPEFDVGAMLTRLQDQALLRVKTAALRNLRLDVQIVSAPNTVLETTTAKNLRGDLDLRVQGGLEHPSWLGRIGVLEGEVTIGGRRYLADRGELTFSNPFRIDPTLDLQVRARVEQYDLRLNFNGPLDHLAITYSSDPPMPTSEILALLVAGSSYAASLHPSGAETSPQLGAASLLSQELNQQMGSRLDRIFGGGHIRVDPQIAGFNQPANSNVALEQHIKDNLTLLYVKNVTAAQQQIIQAEYSLSPRFAVAATRDQNGLIGLSFQIGLRFR